MGPAATFLLQRSGLMFPGADPGVVREAVLTYLDTPIEWGMHLARRADEHARVSLSKIAIPTAFIAGKYDLLASARDMKTAAERIPDAKYVEYAGSHFIQMERPDAVHDELLELIARAEQRLSSARGSSSERLSRPRSTRDWGASAATNSTSSSPAIRMTRRVCALAPVITSVPRARRNSWCARQQRAEARAVDERQPGQVCADVTTAGGEQVLQARLEDRHAGEIEFADEAHTRAQRVALGDGDRQAVPDPALAP